MPSYPDCSETHPDQGMTPEDMRATERVAAQRDEIIMFRSTGAWSRPYIALGHPTKPFHVKGKSSDWGPQAGLVPLDSEFSKAFAAEDIKKGIKANQDALNGNYAKAIPLILSKAFIENHLLAPKGSAGNRPIDRITIPHPGVMYFFCTKPNDDSRLPGKPYVLFGKEVSSGNYEIYSFPLDAANKPEARLGLMEAAGKRLKVLTIFDADKPLTGDYDLFAICPSWNNYGGADRKFDPTLDDPRIAASRKLTEARAKVPGPVTADSLLAARSLVRLQAARTAEDPHRGNITPRIQAAIQSLVREMGGRYPRVHHNAESGRPFAPADAQDAFPLTTFHPRRGIGGYTFLNATITNYADLSEYFRTLYANGYYPPRNHAWHMPSLRNDEAVKAELNRILMQQIARR